jgi:hypothetical protein
MLLLSCTFAHVGRLTEKQTSVRAVTLTRRIIVGTRGGEICEIEKDGTIRVPIQGMIETKSLVEAKLILESRSRRG